MSRPIKIKPKDKALIQRYLIWCYKTTKESLDRIDRKFTQVQVDQFILRQLEKNRRQNQSDISKLINDFKVYTSNKEREGIEQKFSNGNKAVLDANYVYLTNRLSAIELAIRHFLGPRMLSKIELLYEQEMTRRIIESKEH